MPGRGRQCDRASACNAVWGGSNPLCGHLWQQRQVTHQHCTGRRVHIQNSGSYSTLMEQIRRRGDSLSKLTPVWRVGVFIKSFCLFCTKNNGQLCSECGGQLEGSSGVFQSPGYPHSYPHRHMCLWTITVPEGR